MSLLYITIILIIISVLALIVGKVLNKRIIFGSGIAILIFVIIFWIGFYIWALNEEDRENERKNGSVQEQNNISMVELSDYFGNRKSYEEGIELLNKIKDEYQNYLINSNAENKDLYLYFSKDVKKNVDEITKNAIIGMIDDYINTRENDNTGDFNIITGTNEKNEQYICISKIDKEYLSGKIIDVKDDYIKVKEENKEREYRLNCNIVTKQFKNYRTAEDINIADIKVGDYYINGKIIRNIDGEEWQKECIKNLANCYADGNLICNPQEIIEIQNMGDYVIITFIMEDTTSKYFEKRSPNTFELKAKASINLKISTHSKNIAVVNLKEEINGYMYWIGLDKNTLADKYPTIIDIEIYDG